MILSPLLQGYIKLLEKSMAVRYWRAAIIDWEYAALVVCIP